MTIDYEILIRFLLAALWGGLVGAEREYHSKSAGFRTMIMISIGSCFFTMMSELIGGTSQTDRIASNIVTGIGFLGAGVIFRDDNRMSGITTAATIWAVAAVGMGIGAGFYFASAAASVLILIVLAIFPYLEDVIDRINLSQAYTIQITASPGVISEFETLFKSHRLRCKLTRQISSQHEFTLTWQVHGREKHHQALREALMQDKRILRFDV